MAGYSKTRVDRAGRLLAEQIQMAADGRVMVDGNRDEFEEAVEVVDWWRAEHVGPLSAVSANLFRYVGEEGHPVVAQRLKRVPTIAGKLLREKGMKLSRMEDVGGVRAVLPTQEAAYRVARQLRRNWTITRFRDYVSNPKPDGYRALHLVDRNRGRLIEIQLRTPRQDRWANMVEKVAQLFPGVRAGAGPAELRELFVASSDLHAIREGSIPEEEVSLSRLDDIEDAIDRADTFLRELFDES